MPTPLTRTATVAGGASAEWEPPRQYTDVLPSPAVPSTPGRPTRDDSLDVMRTVALVRVVVWHAFGIAFVSWIVATMPIMFFVAGSPPASPTTIGSRSVSC